jgi:hypothetical protein
MYTDTEIIEMLRRAADQLPLDDATKAKSLYRLAAERLERRAEEDFRVEIGPDEDLVGEAIRKRQEVTAWRPTFMILGEHGTRTFGERWENGATTLTTEFVSRE